MVEKDERSIALTWLRDYTNFRRARLQKNVSKWKPVDPQVSIGLEVAHIDMDFVLDYIENRRIFPHTKHEYSQYASRGNPNHYHWLYINRLRASMLECIASEIRRIYDIPIKTLDESLLVKRLFQKTRVSWKTYESIIYLMEDKDLEEILIEYPYYALYQRSYLTGYRCEGLRSLLLDNNRFIGSNTSIIPNICRKFIAQRVGAFDTGILENIEINM